MPRINGWKRQQYYSNLTDAEEALGDEDHMEIGVWTHDEGCCLKHICEPSAEEPFLVRIKETDRCFEEEGRYKYRYQGTKQTRN